MRNSIPTAAVFSVLMFCAFLEPAAAATISFTGNLRTDATVLDCGVGCTLGAGNTDGDYAQYAAVVRTFNVATTSLMSAVSFSYGGGINGAGATVLQGGRNLTLVCSMPVAISWHLTKGGIGQCYDVLLKGGVLAPGSYAIALTADSNLSFAENLGAGVLADGFTGLGNLGLVVGAMALLSLCTR